MSVDDTPKMKQCKADITIARRFREEIPAIVDQLVLSCNRDGCFDHVGPEPIPSREAIIDILHRASRILYPGYFIRTRVDQVNVGYYFGQEVTGIFEALSEQIMLAIRHDCIRHDLPCSDCEERGQQAAIDFLRSMPRLRVLLATDILAAHEGDRRNEERENQQFLHFSLLYPSAREGLMEILAFAEGLIKRARVSRCRRR
jgi:serine O-acetyltransferase